MSSQVLFRQSGYPNLVLPLLGPYDFARAARWVHGPEL